MSDLVLIFDGLNEPVNPGGYGCWGFILYVGTKQSFAGHGCLGNPKWMTNNFAEYCALGFGLKKIIELDLQIKTLTILGDSQLVINQMNGDWAMKSELLAPLHAKCVEYIGAIIKKTGVKPCIRWIPRNLNEPADEMSRQGYREATGKEVPDRK